MSKGTRAAVAPFVLVALLCACAGTTSPSATPAGSEDAVAVFRAFTAALNAGDEAAAAALVDPDATFYADSTATELGVEGLISTLVCTTEITSAEPDGDTAVVELEITGPAPGDPADAECPVGPGGRHRVTIENGRIVVLAEAE
jgi:hypothetical protein